MKGPLPLEASLLFHELDIESKYHIVFVDSNLGLDTRASYLFMGLLYFGGYQPRAINDAKLCLNPSRYSSSVVFVTAKSGRGILAISTSRSWIWAIIWFSYILTISTVHTLDSVIIVKGVEFGLRLEPFRAVPAREMGEYHPVLADPTGQACVPFCYLIKTNRSTFM